MQIERLDRVAAEDLAELNELLAQLSTSAAGLSAEALATLLTDERLDLVVARDEGRIIGMLTLVTFSIPSGIRSWVEDVVVADAARGRGVGRALLDDALQRAANRGAKTVDLTSRPSREAANRLYESAGFLRRETNVYRYSLED